ncbi:MAG: hypothetical protein KW802_00445 [Candidatus Doudnabacteria bacterium]|nr:hypothetical protein [Candidatus Doudnabacteria bacterium]
MSLITNLDPRFRGDGLRGGDGLQGKSTWRLFTESKEIWHQMLTDIANARVSIEMEQYSFWDAKIGHRFLQALEEKHKQGVRIRLICDGYGSYPLFQSKYVAKLQAMGIEILAFNPVSLVRPSTWFYHLHKKTLIIDSKVAWTGGLGIKKKFRHFLDTMARVDGPIVADIERSFDTVRNNILEKNYYFSTDIGGQSEDLKFYVNYCGYGRKEIYEQMRQSIQQAEHSIYLTTSYFFPDRNFFQLILDKARSGVDIKIILRGKDDEYLPVRFSTSYFYKALKAGIGIYRYEPAIIHAKTAIVDSKWATIGSSNLDKFSFYYNMEGNLVSSEAEFVTQVRTLFLEHLRHCRKIELHEWEDRPFRERVIEYMTWPIHNYL